MTGVTTEVCVPGLISAQAARTPSALALADGRVAVTYGELDARSDQLAFHLRTFGVGPESLVALCLERSVNFVIGALGILKAGGAYLPLDPESPVERLAGMLQESQARPLVTRAALAAKLPPGDWTSISLDKEATGFAALPDSPLPSEVTPDNLAYVIFTSGSTGSPKGVEISHANLLNLVLWHRREFAVAPCDRATFLSSPGFDAAVWELWPYLTAGASVHLPDDVTRTSAEALRDWLLREKITLSFVSTPLAEQMMTLPWPEHTPLRALLTGADLLRLYPPRNLPFALVNNYGPTECTVVSTSGPVLPQESSAHFPSIGRPIAHTEVRILGEDLHPVPAGMAGEIFIGGRGVGKGYRCQPALTAEKFIRDPLRNDPSARLYRTGDRGRWLPSGEIEFLGRLDAQVKIRGYRIEPNEIVSALRAHPSIAASAVVARDLHGEKALVAYIVLHSGWPVTLEGLRDHVLSRVPTYMLPSAFVRLDALPVSPSGKVDRSRLPEPTIDNTLRAEEASLAAPPTPTEERVASIMTGLLEVKQIGREQNIFFLGGHSLLGAQIIATIRDSFCVDVTLRDLFDDPTVKGIAARIERLILAKLDAMSEEEVHRALAAHPGG